MRATDGLDDHPDTIQVEATERVGADLSDAGGRSADPDAPPVATAQARVVIGLISLLCLLAGAAAIPLGEGSVRWAAFLVFATVGVGAAPWQLDSAMRLPVRLGFSVVTAFTVWILVSLGMLEAHAWYPAALFALVAVLCAPLHALGIRRALRDLSVERRSRPTRSGRPAPPRLGWEPWASLLLAVGGTALCLVAALRHRHLTPGFYGFLTDIGPRWYLGLALLLLSFVFAGAGRGRLLGTPISLITLVLTLTPALVYDGPRAQSTAKHVELVEAVRSSGVVGSAVDAYNNWPGLFSSIAWFSDVAGLSSVMHVAVFWPPALAVLRLTVLRFFFGQLLPRPWQAWIGVGLTVLADSIGADYFSPQSIGYVLGFGVLGLALSRGRAPARLLLLFLAGGALTVTHQLSPFIVGGILLVLVVFRQVRPWWTPLLVLVPAGAWALDHRSSISQFFSFGQLGRFNNFLPPRTLASSGLERLPVVGNTVAALLAAILLLGLLALVALIRERRDLSAWALALSPSAGLALTAINPYGNEGIFRTALFGLPWLAALAARLFPRPRHLPIRLPFTATATVLAAAFLISSFGLDAATVTRPADVTAIEYPASHNAGSYFLLYLGGGPMPTSTAAGHLDLGRKQVTVPLQQETNLDADQQVEDITAAYVNLIPRKRIGKVTPFAFWSPASSAYDEAYGVQAPDQFARLRDAFLRSPYWFVAFQRDGTYLFQLDVARYTAAVGP